MRVCYLNDKERGQSRDLWKEAFPEDSEAFGAYYYTEKIRDNKILALVSTDAGSAVKPEEILAMVHLNPYEVHAKQCRWKTDYIVGVATRVTERHKGHMRRLLLRMMEDMRNDEMPFCFLMPASPDIYRPFDFAYIYDQSKWKLKEGMSERLERISLLSVQNACEMQDMWLNATENWMEAWTTSHYDLCTVRDQAYVKLLMKELRSEAGEMDLLLDQDRIVGLQCEWGLEKREQRLLYMEDGYSEEAGEAQPAIMARIITLEKFLEPISLNEAVEDQEISIVLRVKDLLIEGNQGVWCWKLNHSGSTLERMMETEDESGIELTIAELAQWIFGYQVPKQAEAYRDIVNVFQGVFLDEVV